MKIYYSITVIGLLSCIKLCASNSLNDEYEPEILGSPNLERTERTKGRRNPRIFWGTTTTSTSTLSTTTACYTTAASTSGSCSGKKKRSLMLDEPIEGATYDLRTGQIFPSKNGSLLKKKKEKSEAERNDKSMALSKLDELSQIANVRATKGARDVRVEPRFFLFYWYTSTITTTSTTYTSTTTFSLRACTPATFSYSACG